jgi:predicted RNase H-like HicB family nuclease
MNRTLLCVAEGREGEWEAICLDLDIAVQGQSFDEVRSLLNEAICTYLEDACREDASVRDKLLNRRAPLLVRLSYIARFVAHALRGTKRDGGLHGSFEVPCPA